MFKNAWICINKELNCDDPKNKKGFKWKGKIFSPNWIKVFDIKEFGGVMCAVVAIYHFMGCSYYGAEKIIPLSEFEKTDNWHFCNPRDEDERELPQRLTDLCSSI